LASTRGNRDPLLHAAGKLMRIKVDKVLRPTSSMKRSQVFLISILLRNRHAAHQIVAACRALECR